MDGTGRPAGTNAPSRSSCSQPSQHAGRPWISAPLATDIVLVFDCGKTLAAHSQILRLSSQVLNDVFESGLPRMDADGALLLQLPGDVMGDWELVLEMLYPMLPGTPDPRKAITWDNAERLLLLADKWDLAGVKEAAGHFLLKNWAKRSTTAAHYHQDLPVQLKWLSLAGRTGLRALFDAIAAEIVMHHGSQRVTYSISSATYNSAHVQYSMSGRISRAGQAISNAVAECKEGVRASLESLSHADLVLLLQKLLVREQY